jgi:hypothetical protein
MRILRMKTRRWMIAVAALSVALGGYREVTRLKRIRVQCLMRAAWHNAEETDHRRIVSSSAASVVRKKMAGRESGAPEPAGPTPDRAIELLSGFPERNTTQADEDGHARFKEAQARVGTMAARRGMILDKNLQRQMDYHQRCAEYHAELGRKYAAAAAYPWLSVTPDPPEPK